MINKIKHLFTATMVSGILLFSASAGHASDSTAEALALAQSIAQLSNDEALSLRSNIPADVEAQRQLMNRLLERTEDNVTKLLEDAKSANVRNIDIYEQYINLISADTPKTESRAIIEKLTVAAASKDWKRSNLANIFLGTHFIHERDSLQALAYARNALEAIPARDNSLRADDARYETYDLLHTAFTVDRNINKMIKATENLIAYGEKTNRKIDKITLIHNLGYLYSKSFDFDTASKISALLINLQNGQTDYHRSIANYSHGTNLSEAGHYDEAIPYLEKAVNLSADSRFGVAAKIRLAFAYSKSGQIRKSQNLIFQLENSTAERGTYDKMLLIINRAKAENAYRAGDYSKAYTYLNRWSDSRAKELEADLFEDRRRASEGLALSERVSREREARLQSEVALSKQVAQRGFMIAIFAGLLAGALAFITFILNQQRKRQIEINAALAVARDQALAGEKAKSSFLSMMGHELRTPMNPIISLAEILYARVKDKETQQMLKMISSSGRAMLSMVENILIVADETKRKLIISPQKTKVRDFIRFTSQAFQRDAIEKGVDFNAHIDPNVPEYLDIDKLKVRSIITNILSNAVKFTDQGEILMSVLVVDDSYAGVSILLSVKDTGSGMTQDEIDNLRSVFRQRDVSHTKAYDGVGVGLYVSELYTKAHGGRMVVSSHPQDGTRVDIYLPLQEATKRPNEPHLRLTTRSEQAKPLPAHVKEQEAA